MVSAKSKRARKRHVQQALFRRGGKRRGAGRKPKGVRAGERHGVRPEFKPSHALHVVMRVVPAVGEPQAAQAVVDPFSSGIRFPDWKELEDKAWMWPIRATYDPLVVRRPRTWLLAEGWKLGGGPISKIRRFKCTWVRSRPATLPTPSLRGRSHKCSAGGSLVQAGRLQRLRYRCTRRGIARACGLCRGNRGFEPRRCGQ